MSRRRRHVPPDLTSLFDVLFIVIFAALIRAAAVQQAAIAAPVAKPVAPPAPPAPLHARALAQLATQIAARPTVVVRVSAAGTITALEHGAAIDPLDTPLLETSADRDVGLAYLGDRSAEQRICRLVALHLRVDLAGYLVIVAPDRRLADLSHALYEGLRRDIDRCASEQRGLAVLVEPS